MAKEDGLKMLMQRFKEIAEHTETEMDAVSFAIKEMEQVIKLSHFNSKVTVEFSKDVMIAWCNIEKRIIYKANGLIRPLIEFPVIERMIAYKAGRLNYLMQAIMQKMGIEIDTAEKKILGEK